MGWRFVALSAIRHEGVSTLVQAFDSESATIETDRTDRTATFISGPRPDAEQLMRAVVDWLYAIAPLVEPSAATQDADLLLAIEVFVSAWAALTAQVNLSPDDRRQGDALAAMANEVSKCEEPDRPALRAAFDWFARKADHFADEFAGAAGKTAGGAAALAAAAAASGHVDDLKKIIARVLSALAR